jgi:hypothetical protein
MRPEGEVPTTRHGELQFADQHSQRQADRQAGDRVRGGALLRIAEECRHVVHALPGRDDAYPVADLKRQVIGRQQVDVAAAHSRRHGPELAAQVQVAEVLAGDLRVRDGYAAVVDHRSVKSQGDARRVPDSLRETLDRLGVADDGDDVARHGNRVVRCQVDLSGVPGSVATHDAGEHDVVFILLGERSEIWETRRLDSDGRPVQLGGKLVLDNWCQGGVRGGHPQGDSRSEQHAENAEQVGDGVADRRQV